MDIAKELQRIYNSEVNFSISTFWDGGFDVKLGDKMNGFVCEITTDTMEQAILWLIKKVLEYYPESLYSYSRMNIINKIKNGNIDTRKLTDIFLSKMIIAEENKNPSIYRDLEIEYRNTYFGGIS